MKQQVDETASWWNSKLTKQVDETASWQNNKLMKQQVDETASWWNSKLTKQVDETASWCISNLKKCQVDRMTWHTQNWNIFLKLIGLAISWTHPVYPNLKLLAQVRACPIIFYACNWNYRLVNWAVQGCVQSSVQTTPVVVYNFLNLVSRFTTMNFFIG